MADGNLPVCFLTNNDITGGNSESGFNADGHLIDWLDGNWESMSGDVIFEPELQRYLGHPLCALLMDKFGGAGYLLKEMNIVNDDLTANRALLAVATLGSVRGRGPRLRGRDWQPDAPAVPYSLP